jgi:hypothetical protein
MVRLGAAMLAGAALVGCATPPPPAQRTTREQISFDAGSGFDITLLRDESVSTDTVSRAPNLTWRGLVATYASLGLPILGADAPRRIIATRHFRAHGAFAGERMSRWMDCGSSITGDIATSYEITMRLASVIDSLQTGQSVLHTAVNATAAATGGGTTPVHCRSLGGLEKRIAAGVRENAQP